MMALNKRSCPSRMTHINVTCPVRRITIFLLLTLPLAASWLAPEIPPNLLQPVQWPLIAPHLGGRVTSVCGVPSQPAIYYIGTPGGGVWKTEDGGQVTFIWV